MNARSLRSPWLDSYQGRIVARNRELTDVVKTGVVETSEARDYTVKADVTGLRAGYGPAEVLFGVELHLARGEVDDPELGEAHAAG